MKAPRVIPATYRAPSLSPKKILASKWTAVHPQHKEKHFVVVSLVEPEPIGAPLVTVILEAVYSKRQQAVAWRSLQDVTQWRQGWT
jgi:tryptophan-rich hypothetical protein